MVMQMAAPSRAGGLDSVRRAWFNRGRVVCTGAAEATVALGPQSRIGDRRTAELRLEESAHLLREMRRPASILLAEVDQARGDGGVEAAARGLQTVLRTDDFVGQWVGDVLICILPNCRLRDAARIAERCLERVSLSCGATELRMAEHAADAVDRATQLMRKSRALGRNRVSAG